MKVKMYGTRGSLPVSSPQTATYGGNTTCLRIYSDCLPPSFALVVDAGSGFAPMSADALGEGVNHIGLLQTHYHHDHTQGALIAPPFYMDSMKIDILGPVENGIGPREVYEAIMRQPFHPVDFKTIAHHISFHKIEHPSIKVILIHPQGGLKIMDIEAFNRLCLSEKQMPFKEGKFALEECLEIRMYYADHPERTIAYRFNEHTTGRSFVFLTDEECRAALPVAMRRFLSGGVNLLIQDAQYSAEEYRNTKAGFGHGTPEYVAEIALACWIPRVGLTHHDPRSTDDDINDLQNNGNAYANATLTVFACADYQEIDV